MNSTIDLNTMRQEARSIAARATALEKTTEAVQSGVLLGTDVEDTRTELILAILSTGTIGQELLRRVEEADKIKPGLFADATADLSKLEYRIAAAHLCECHGETVCPDKEKQAESPESAIYHGTVHVAADSELGRAISDVASRLSLTSPKLTGTVTGRTKFDRPNIAGLMRKHGGFFVPEKGYEDLFGILMEAHDQAALGKGKERHANNLPFSEQRMQGISTLLDSPDGMAYQVAKKVAEGLQFEDPEKRDRELLGAIVYAAGMMLWLRERDKKNAE